MKTFLKILFTVVYLFLIPKLFGLVKITLFSPLIPKTADPDSGWIALFIIMRLVFSLILAFYIFLAYQAISRIVDGVFFKEKRKIIIGLSILVLISALVIFYLYKFV